MPAREGFGVMLFPAVLALIMLVVWMTVAVSDRLWTSARLMPLPLRRRR
jgi:hypothetical protein